MENRSNNSLRYVACVSYPRSGHHLTAGVLRRYFADAFVYCQYYQQDADACCQSFPCTNAKVTMTKNHDMDIAENEQSGIPQLPGVPYLVLLRNFLEAAVSDYHLYLRGHEDSCEAWRAFATRKSVFYRRFVNKWLNKSPELEILIVRYEDLTARPLQTYSKITEFFKPSEPIDTEHLQNVIKQSSLADVTPTGTNVIHQFGVRNRRKIEEFAHYDKEFFAELEASVADELAAVGYPLRFQKQTNPRRWFSFRPRAAG
ncbi:MAG: sulfotransferase domain-containing protein [Pirellulaceae bacterium]|nr:sulfotransferase domain-containing protein [Pirellulaceae bacterium]